MSDPKTKFKSQNPSLDVLESREGKDQLPAKNPLIENVKEDPVEALAKQRSFRDRFIEEEEKRWNTPKKQMDTVEKEKEELRKGLPKYADKIVEGLKSRKEPLQQIEELPTFLTACGVNKEIVEILESALPLEAPGVAPRIKCWVVALYETINGYCKNPALLSEENFSATFVQTFQKIRLQNFVADETNYLKYLDTLGAGYYSSPEAQKAIYEKAAATLNSPTQTVEEAA